jgi:hypothetical protein
VVCRWGGVGGEGGGGGGGGVDAGQPNYPCGYRMRLFHVQPSSSKLHYQLHLALADQSFLSGCISWA